MNKYCAAFMFMLASAITIAAGGCAHGADRRPAGETSDRQARRAHDHRLSGDTASASGDITELEQRYRRLLLDVGGQAPESREQPAPVAPRDPDPAPIVTPPPSHTTPAPAPARRPEPRLPPPPPPESSDTDMDADADQASDEETVSADEVHNAIRLPAEQRSGLTVQPQAVIRISVAEDTSLNGNYSVNDLGAVSLGYVGPVILFNHTEARASDKIREILISRGFRDATVEVEILRASYDRVSVQGRVHRPGTIRIGAGDAISLNDALLRVGGLRGTVQGLQVRVVRGAMINVLASAEPGEVYAMQDTDGRPIVPNVLLYNNDRATVFSGRSDLTEEELIEYGAKEVLVFGEVRREGPIRFSATEPATMMRLVFKMGGFPRYANQRAIRILRRDENGVDREIVVDVTEIMATGDPDSDVAIKDGDRIIVPARRISLF